MTSQYEKRNRFEKVAQKRVQFILDKLELLSNCSNKSNYDYSEEDVKKMFSAIKERMKQVEARFQDELSKRDKSKFKF
jgi:isopropylmalate/homocitrate/citramalate synthase